MYLKETKFLWHISLDSVCCKFSAVCGIITNSKEICGKFWLFVRSEIHTERNRSKHCHHLNYVHIHDYSNEKKKMNESIAIIWTCSKRFWVAFNFANDENDNRWALLIHSRSLNNFWFNLWKRNREYPRSQFLNTQVEYVGCRHQSNTDIFFFSLFRAPTLIGSECKQHIDV